MQHAYPALLNLIRGYFHQDYDLLSEDADEIVRIYHLENPLPIQKELVSNIQRFLEAHQNETDDELLQALRTTFRPEFAFYGWNGRTTREALEKIIEIVSETDNSGAL
jgi:hypothetical protein